MKYKLLKELWFGCFSFRGRTAIAWWPEARSNLNRYSFCWSTLYADCFNVVLPNTMGRSEQQKSWVPLLATTSLTWLWTIQGENVTLSFSEAVIYLIFLGKINLYQRSSRNLYHLEMVAYSFPFLFFLPFESCKSLPSSMLTYFFKKSTFFYWKGLIPALTSLFFSYSS